MGLTNHFLNFIMNHPAMIKTAVLHQKQNTIMEADFVAEYIKKWRWVIYQWAVVEDVGSFIKEMGAKSLKEAQHGLQEQYGLQMPEEELKRLLPWMGVAF